MAKKANYWPSIIGALLAFNVVVLGWLVSETQSFRKTTTDILIENEGLETRINLHEKQLDELWKQSHGTPWRGPSGRI